MLNDLAVVFVFAVDHAAEAELSTGVKVQSLAYLSPHSCDTAERSDGNVWVWFSLWVFFQVKELARMFSAKETLISTKEKHGANQKPSQVARPPKSCTTSPS